MASSKAAGGTRGVGSAPCRSTGFPRDGSTATVLLLVGNKLFVANCGDSAGKTGGQQGGTGRVDGCTRFGHGGPDYSCRFWTLPERYMYGRIGAI